MPHQLGAACQAGSVAATQGTGPRVGARLKPPEPRLPPQASVNAAKQPRPSLSTEQPGFS